MSGPNLLGLTATVLGPCDANKVGLTLGLAAVGDWDGLDETGPMVGKAASAEGCGLGSSDPTAVGVVVGRALPDGEADARDVGASDGSALGASETMSVHQILLRQLFLRSCQRPQHPLQGSAFGFASVQANHDSTYNNCPQLESDR